MSQINPLQTVPVLVDGTFKLTESRAIAAYLSNHHGNKEEAVDLCPSLAQDKARVDEMLYYDATVVTKRFQELMVSSITGVKLAGCSKSTRVKALCNLDNERAYTNRRVQFTILWKGERIFYNWIGERYFK